MPIQNGNGASDPAESVGSAITGVSSGSNALRGTEAQTDGEYADKLFKKHEDEIKVTRKESYLQASNALRMKQAKEGKKDVEWDKLNPEELSEVLGVSINMGLTAAEAKIRFDRDGPNELEKSKRPTLAFLFLLQLLNLIIVLLIIAAVASLLVKATGPDRREAVTYVDSIAIFIIVLLNAGIGASTENSAAGALEALSKLAQPKTSVLRDGKEEQIPSTKVVKGDVLLLHVGDIVPADVRLVQSDDLKVNEMLLTGEPEDVSKFARMKTKKAAKDDGHGEKLTPENMAFSSCMVTNGKAKAFVVEIGMNTRVGRIAMLLSDGDGPSPSNSSPEELDKFGQKVKPKKAKKRCLPDTSSNQTPLQKSLQRLGVLIGMFAILACAVVFIIGASLGVYNISNPSANGTGDIIVYMILVAVTLAVAAIPEGIPLCVTISLATGCNDMVKENVLVRRIAAVETLGCASVICTDKTGTLTEGKMTMVKMWAGGLDFDVSGKGFDPTVGKITYKGGNNNGQDAKDCQAVIGCLTSGILCCNTKVVQEVDKDDGKKKWKPHGNSSEAPIIVAAGKIGKWTNDTEKFMPRIFEVPFSSSRKMMLTVVQTGNNGDSSYAGKTFGKMMSGSQPPKYIANIKGAPNFILNDCDSWTKPDGTVVPFSEEEKQRVLKRVDELSSEALRVLAIAARPLPEMPFDYKNMDLDMTTDQKFEAIVKQPGMVLLGLVASIDPERDGVPQAVLDAQGGHIRVVMITGDYLPTAIAIAHNVNILHTGDDESSAALDCGKLRPTGDYLPDPDIDYLTKTVKVFARAQPEDKLQIVKSLQRQGLVSAMTGDGVNDAPALKRADIGVAMGLQGTEVAKGASDMILTDDNFCSIVKAVEKGRIIYAGIQKFIAFIMSVHLAEVLQIFLCIVANIPIMRTPLQILFLILVTDLPPSVALGMEKVARDILKDTPRPKKQPILLMWQWQGVVANGLVIVVTTLAVYIWALSFYLNKTFQIPDIAFLFCNGDCDSEAAKNKEFNEDALQSLRYARTTAFISLVYSENIRAYTSRSFTDPFWVDLCTNTAMQKAIGMAQVALYIAVFVPGLSDVILELEGVGIGWQGWVAALCGALATLVLCELYKFVSKTQIRAAQRKVEEDLAKAEAERQKLVTERMAQVKAERKLADQPAAKF